MDKVFYSIQILYLRICQIISTLNGISKANIYCYAFYFVLIRQILIDRNERVCFITCTTHFSCYFNDFTAPR